MKKEITRKNNHAIELLAPAGNLEKLKYSFHYGADAVYAGVPDVSLRVRINNFDKKTLREGVEYAHALKKKIYITANIYAHNRHLKNIEEHLKFLHTLDIDGIIISDPGIIELAKKYLPNVDIHLSTQANATNWRAVKFWLDRGVKRVILAREVSLSEIREIKKRVPKMELEYFIHGAMCMSYSGRCILSKWMTSRSANLGDCSQPCRWLYNIKSKKEKVKSLNVIDDQKRFEMEIEEDSHGTYFFNSRDLNLAEYIYDLAESGITSLKIEGRAKSLYYVAIVCRSYRKIIDAVSKKYSKEKLKKIIREAKKELENLPNRGYTTGFITGGDPEHNFSGKIFWDKFKFIGEILGRKNGLNKVKVHNEIKISDNIEAVGTEKNEKVKIIKIYNDKMQEISEAHGGHDKKYYFKVDRNLEPRTLLRKKL